MPAFRITSLLLMFSAGCANVPRAPLSGDSADFAKFMETHQLAPGNPGDDVVRRGREVFLNGPCVMCHTIRGTVAHASAGPDLTHLAARRTLAAGTLPNTRGNLAGWILNPQNLKPQTKMPPTLLASEDLHALVAFLETLQ